MQILLLALFVAAAPGQKKRERSWNDDLAAPSFQGLPSATEIGSLSMVCDGEPPFREIECVFFGATVTPPDMKRVEKEDSDRAAEASKDTSLARRMCANTKKEPQGTLVGNPEALSTAAAIRTRFLDGCERCTAKECGVVAEMAANEARICRLWSQTFRLRLTRIGLDRWTHTGTSGLCDSSLVANLVREREILWTFEQHRIPAPKEAQTHPELCAGESRLKYTWNAQATVDLSKACPSGWFTVR